MTRGNKFHARRTSCNHGHVHASGREAMRCNDLHLLERGGQIAGLQQQPKFFFVINGQQVKFPNGRRAVYSADFSYIEDGRKVVEDVKSAPTMTEAATLRMALFRALWPDVELRVVR